MLCNQIPDSVFVIGAYRGEDILLHITTSYLVSIANHIRSRYTTPE